MHRVESFKKITINLPLHWLELCPMKA